MTHDSPAPPAFDFDGRSIPFVEGQSVGAALTAAGVRSWRTTRLERRPRGLVCGIGVGVDCLVVADGPPHPRAGRLPARAGLTVTTQEGTGRDHLAI